MKKKITSKSFKNLFIGRARNINDHNTFSKITLIAFFAWIGLGSDALSSSCYGPEEIFRTLAGHTNLAFIVALFTAFTILIISTSYIQIIKLFPHGGGGYIVASTLISPTVGMVSGSALLIDYVLTIAISISSGADAIFSFVPAEYQSYRIFLAYAALGVLIILNLRGVRESVMSLTPIFVVFVATHLILIGYVLITHVPEIHTVAHETSAGMSSTVGQLGIWGTIFLIFKAYSMGAGTYTGIEAVSNGIPNLREPKVATATITMRLLASSLGIAVLGLIFSYYLLGVSHQDNKTFNAILIEKATIAWPHFWGQSFIYITLISEAALLFVAAQTGFLDGPRVMANMANDYWLPRRFTSLSDRLVSENGIILMGIAAFVTIFLSGGSVKFLVILYSINVFITFTLSQFGMVRHWIIERKKDKKWFRKMLINGIGLVLTSFILITVTVIKFFEGGWITLLITLVIVSIAILIKKHYLAIAKEVSKIQRAMNKRMAELIELLKSKKAHSVQLLTDPTKAPTAVLLVNGYTGLGLYSLFRIINSFQGSHTNYVFIQIGMVDSSSMKGVDHLDQMKENIQIGLKKYEYIVNQLGYNSDSYCAMGTDVADEVEKMIPEIIKKYPNSTFIGGQLIFEGMYRITRILHNFTIFSIQRRLYKQGISTIVLPISLDKMNEYLNTER